MPRDFPVSSRNSFSSLFIRIRTARSQQGPCAFPRSLAPASPATYCKASWQANCALRPRDGDLSDNDVDTIFILPDTYNESTCRLPGLPLSTVELDSRPKATLPRHCWRPSPVAASGTDLTEAGFVWSPVQIKRRGAVNSPGKCN
jgi:hypothetical protein